MLLIWSRIGRPLLQSRLLYYQDLLKTLPITQRGKYSVDFNLAAETVGVVYRGVGGKIQGHGLFIHL
jgi:hypothetical protein